MATNWVRMRHINTGVVTDVHPKIVNSYGRKGWVDEAKSPKRPARAPKVPDTAEPTSSESAPDPMNGEGANPDNENDKESA